MFNDRTQNLVQYMAYSNPNAVNKLAYEYGYLPPVTLDGRKGLLFSGLMDEGENFLRSMAKYHPDRDLILNAEGLVVSGMHPREDNILDLRPITRGNSADGSEVIKNTGADKSALLSVIMIVVMIVIVAKFVFD